MMIGDISSRQGKCPHSRIYVCSISEPSEERTVDLLGLSRPERFSDDLEDLLRRHAFYAFDLGLAGFQQRKVRAVQLA